MSSPMPPEAVDADSVRAALREVIDPEAGMNIVDLGLIYGVDLASGKVSVRMTMTSPACPMGEMIIEDVETVLRKLLPPSVSTEVEMVFEPPWDPSMMSDEARGHFGWSEE